jgi:hypothetical protein
MSKGCLHTHGKPKVKVEKDSHFHDKSVVEHLRETRMKGFRASQENHGLEPQGHIIAGADAAKETAIVTLLLWIVLSQLQMEFFSKVLALGFVTLGILLWKSGRSALLSWGRLERVNRLIADEKHEIETNRQEEKEELTEIYRAKGFTPPLLEKVIDVLMADDNKLLGVMLEEELGVTLEIYEHPLKQALGAGIGVFLSSCLIVIGLMLQSVWGLFFTAYLTIFIASYVTAKKERIRPLPSIVWNLSLAFLVSFAVYFLTLSFLERGLLSS